MIKVSIIIPTYNRPAYLRRILDYYNDCGKDFNIIVADSSSNENKRLNKRIIQGFPNINISYLNDYPPELRWFHKVADAVNHVEEKYCVLCADDDFVTPNGINQSVDFLEKNPDFTVAHGYYIGFYLKTDEEGNQQFYWKPAYSHESITFSDPKLRLNYHLSNYSQLTIYGVHRADFLKVILEETAKFTDDDRFGELLPSMLTLIYGKMKCLDVLYGAREVLPNSGGRTSKRLNDFFREGTYNEKYARFRDCLSTHLSKQSQLDIKESKKVVDDAMSAYMKKHYPVKPLISKMKDILDYLRLPDWMDRGIRRSYRELTRLSRTKKYSIDMSPSSEYYDDFNKIRLHVLSHSKINLK